MKSQRLSEAAQIADRFQLSPLTGRVLAARGFAADDSLQRFLNPSLRDGLPAPDGLKNLVKSR